jgi:protein phosphatase
MTPTINPILDMVTASHAGRVRLQNEDFVAIDRALGLAVLADGMGGHNAGEVASRMAVEVVTSGISAELSAELVGSWNARRVQAFVAGHLSRANARVYAAGRGHRDHAGMGTTLLVALWHDGNVTVAHVGDSRLYRLRARELTQLTRDHTLAQEQIDRGTVSFAQARGGPLRSILTRTIGNEVNVVPDLNTFEVATGDVYLLCSDGLTDMLTDEQISQALVFFGARIQESAHQLVEQANEQGGLDNISVVIVRARSDTPRELIQ